MSNSGRHCTTIQKLPQLHSYNRGKDLIIQLNDIKWVQRAHKLSVRMKHLHQHLQREFPQVMEQLSLKFQFCPIDNCDQLPVAIPAY